MDGKLSGGHIPRTQALGYDRFLSLTQPWGILRAVIVLWAPQSTHVGTDSALGPPSAPKQASSVYSLAGGMRGGGGRRRRRRRTSVR